MATTCFYRSETAVVDNNSRNIVIIFTTHLMLKCGLLQVLIISVSAFNRYTLTDIFICPSYKVQSYPINIIYIYTRMAWLCLYENCTCSAKRDNINEKLILQSMRFLKQKILCSKSGNSPPGKRNALLHLSMSYAT